LVRRGSARTDGRFSPPSLTRMPQLHSQRMHAVAFHRSRARWLSRPSSLLQATELWIPEGILKYHASMPTDVSSIETGAYHFCRARALEDDGGKVVAADRPRSARRPRRSATCGESARGDHAEVAQRAPPCSRGRMGSSPAKSPASGGCIASRRRVRRSRRSFDALLVWGMNHALGPPPGGKPFIPGGRWTRSCDTSRNATARHASHDLGVPLRRRSNYTIHFDGRALDTTAREVAAT